MFALNVGLQGVQPLGAETGLADPLKTVAAISSLIDAGHGQGFTFRLSSDFTELARLRRELRNSDVSPMFDPQAGRSQDPWRKYGRILEYQGSDVSFEHGERARFRIEIPTPFGGADTDGLATCEAAGNVPFGIGIRSVGQCTGKEAQSQIILVAVRTDSRSKG